MEVQLVVAGGNKAGQAIPIQGPKFLIGRADDCHLKPRSELISRYHCAIISEDGYVAIRDLGSKNGVYLNGERVSLESELKNGDKLSIGPLEFSVNLSIGTKIPKKTKVDSIEAAIVRTVEIEEEQAKKEKEHTKPAQEQPPLVDHGVTNNDAIKKEILEVKKEPIVEKIPETTQEKTNEDSSGLKVEDWLLGSGDSSQQNMETKTVRAPRPSTVEVFVPEHEETKSQDEAEKTTDREKKEGESSKFGVQKAASSRDAAANLLKNFFKGGR